ncbi:MAG: formaldehyde-activating enzyme [Acidimicrobiales bacterium]|jgi:5,6,7,8-tetrahydromethanopterin hydro-lyase
METTMQIGEGFVGEGVDAAHVNTVLGDRSGPVGAAWAAGLAGPSMGHAGFMVVGQPGIAAVPPTLFVNKAPIENPGHGLLTWGPAQAGVAKGVALALEEGVIEAAGAAGLVLIAAVWVNPSAADTQAVFANNTVATLQALRNGREGRPSVADAMAAGLSPWNPFFRP